MNILKSLPLLCVLATTAFVAVHSSGYPSHVLSRRNVDLKFHDTPGIYVDRSAEIQESPRVARDLSPDVKDDLQKIFTVENFLSIAQKFLKIVLKITETITSYIPARSVREAILVLGFPGSKAVATIAEEVMKFINELAAEVGDSDFIVKEPTKENFWKMLSDTVLLGLKKTKRMNALLLQGVKKAFTESKQTTYNVFDNVKITSPVAKNFLENIHTFFGQVFKGLVKISNDKIKNTIVFFIKAVKLPFAQQLAQIVDILISGFNAVSKELVECKFIKEPADIKNLNKFIVAAIKTILIKSMEKTDEILKIILAAVQEAKGVKVDTDVGELPVVSVTEGSAIEVINKVLSFFVNINAEETLKKIHKFVSFSARFVLDVTNDPGVMYVPQIIRNVGQQLTDIGAKSADFLIQRAHKAALEATKSKFVKEPPSWENARDFLLSAIKSSLQLVIEVTVNMKNYFDSTVAQSVKVPGLVKDILRTIIPESALSVVQDKVKVIAKGIENLTAAVPKAAIKSFITSSELPFYKELSNVAGKIMEWVNNIAKLTSQSDFVNKSATVENAVLALTEILKFGVSTGLQLLSEILQILESLF